MSDIPAKYSQALKLTHALREGITKLEKTEFSGNSSAAAAQARSLDTKYKELEAASRELEGLWNLFKIQDKSSKRGIWKRKVEQISEETDSLRMALSKFSARVQSNQREEADRAELLQRSTGDTWRRDQDEEAAMAKSVGNSKRVLAQTLETGAAVLMDMGANRERLKSAQRKALDVLNSLGLSDAVLRIIERRQKMDKYITYGGMVGILILVVVLWYCLRKWQG